MHPYDVENEGANQLAGRILKEINPGPFFLRMRTDYKSARAGCSGPFLFIVIDVSRGKV